LRIDQPTEGGKVKAVSLKGGNDGGADTAKQKIFHQSTPFSLAKGQRIW
jgi:hypothetical protein